MNTTNYSLLDDIRNDPESPRWAEFVFLYRPILEDWTRKNGFRPTDDEDLTQEVLQQIPKSLPGYKQMSGAKFRSWLFTIAKRTANRFRQSPDLPQKGQ